MNARIASTMALVVALALVTVPTPSAGQENSRFGVSLFGGVQNTPAAFDVLRSVEYDTGMRFGAALFLRIDEYVAVRGTFAQAGNSGQESGVVTDAVDFTRQYFGADVQVSYPVTPALAPYIFAGGGLVRLDRSAPSYAYDMTEGGALVGLGLRYHIGPALELFAEGQGWIYSRQTVGETQVDRTLNVGLTYQLR
jgi:hypothetical protein